MRVKEIPADLETPVTAFLKLQPIGATFLLESVEQGEKLGRFSFIGVGSTAEYTIKNDGLDRLRADFKRKRHAPHPDLPPLDGGAVGYLSYDFVRTLENLPSRLPDDLKLPLGRFVVARDLVVFDHIKRKILLLADDPRPILDAFKRPAEIPASRKGRPAPYRDSMTQKQFKAAVGKAHDYIRAGDIFQVVLSHRQSRELRAHPFQVYRALRILNPSPYMFYFDFGDHQLVSSSPEMHAKLSGRVGSVRPIAGTRPRGADDADDLRLQKELLADPKERAEHLMLIDLARNDLGRASAYGTVTVPELYAVEKYSHVQHIVSEVRGTLRDDVDQFQLLCDTFPAGTVTGAPKIRAMQIIDELETVRRGPYAGAAGYFSLAGHMDMCITIRTLVVKDGVAHLQAGAGIVADSKPDAEWQETLNKMAGLKKAVDMAEAGL